jgi:signal transduction histidine kinase
LFCPSCGKEAMASSKFCVSCGASLTGPQQTAPSGLAPQTLVPTFNGTQYIIEQKIVAVRDTYGIRDRDGNLLAYVEFERGEINLQDQEIRLPELLQSVVQPFEPEIKERGLTVHFDLEAEVPPLWLDPEKVGLLLANLIENGIKFNERHGQLRVAARMLAGDLEVAISNTGTSIPADGIAKLMQPFIQGDMSMTRSAGGLGLGLAVARVIVDAYRGQITIESGTEGGTTVRVRLSLRASRPAPVDGV